MHPTFRALLRPIASLALAVALAGPIALTNDAQAQLGRRLPSPVSATQLEQMLRDADLPDTTKDAALPLHEAYFARFREFEKNELDPALARPRESPFDLSQSVDAARKESDLLRRTFQKAAELDGQLVSELEGVLPAEDAWKARKLRDALTRRRVATLAPSFSTRGKPLEYSLRGAPVLGTLDPDTRRIVNLALEIYESELTRQCERYASAAFERIVKGAEIRDEMGVGAPPQAGADGQGADQINDWMSKVQAAQQRADEDTRAAMTRIRKLHREGLEQVMPLIPSPDARALRNHMMAALYPMLREKSAFDAVYDSARTMHAKGEIDESKWHGVQDLADANELSSRPLCMDMMALLDQRSADGDSGMLMIGGGPLGETTADGAASEEAQKLERLKKSLATLDASNADTLRAMLGLAPAAEPDGRGVDRNGIDIGQLIANGGGDVQFEGTFAIGVAGAGGGDMIVLSGEDMADGGMFIGGFGGGGDRLPRPMGRDELDALAERLGFAKDSRPVFDEIAARAQEARNLAEQEFKPAQQFQTIEDGGMAVTLTLSDDSGVQIGGGGDNEKLVAAIEVAEETLFDELKAAAASDKAAAVEAARRARARVRLLPGESGAQSVDLVAVADKAALAGAARAKITADLAAWDESSVDALRTMKREVKALDKERQELFKEATKEVTQDDGQGSVSVSRSVQIEGDIATRLEQIETRIAAARTRIAEGNRKTVDALVATLDGDAAAQTALRRAFLRAANPSIYKTPRDLEPFFAKAEAIPGVTAAGKTAINTLRAEWIESREARCEEFCIAQDKRTASATLSNVDDGVQQMQARMRERKKAREDLEQVESTIFRKLQELLIVDIGPDKAKDLGELPVRKKPQMPTIQFGG